MLDEPDAERSDVIVRASVVFFEIRTTFEQRRRASAMLFYHHVGAGSLDEADAEPAVHQT
ncbi:MAG TPA: hypothetical protein VGG74_35860 [Kofleriaceae bacterium]|jgi:hypothetical protein